MTFIVSFTATVSGLNGRVSTAYLYFHMPTTIACPLGTIAQISDTKSFKSAKRSHGAGKTTIALWQMRLKGWGAISE